MPNNPSGIAEKPKFGRLLLFTAGIVYFSSVVLVIAIFHNPEWHAHLLRLMGRAWSVFVAQDVGSTGRGFLNGCLEAILGVGAVAAMTGYLFGLKEFRKHLIETATVGLFAVATVALIVYGVQFAWEVAKEGYKDHQVLKTDNLELTSQLHRQNRGITSDDPAYMGFVQILREFQSYGSQVKGQPCTIYFTATEDSRAVAQAIAETSALVSGCHTFGPDAPMMPESSSNENEGMIPGVIVVHTIRSSRYSPAVVLQRGLGNLLPTSLSYIQPKNPDFPITKNFMWLQFGTGVGWKQ